MSSHTLSPFLNGVKVDFHRSIIRVRASSCAARASSLFLMRAVILSSIVGYFVFSNDKGTAIGELPNINSNGVFGLSVWRLLL